MADSPTSSRAEEIENVADLSTSDRCLKHKVTKHDTLAGLAIKYNVSVSDIKRANGLLSDTGMWAREELLIPREGLPITEDAKLMVSQILSGANRDPILNKQHNQKPGSTAAAFLKKSRSFNGSTQYDYEDEAGSPYSRRSNGESSEAGDVELMERTAGSTEFIPYAEAGGYGTDRVRRRKPGQQQGDEGPSSSSSSNGLHHPSSRSSHQHRPPPAGSSNAAWQSLSNIGRSITNSSLVQKIKQAASQPALAKPTYNTFSDAADAVITSLSHCGPQGVRDPAPMLSRAPSGSTSMQRTLSNAGLAAAPPKLGGKNE